MTGRIAGGPQELDRALWIGGLAVFAVPLGLLAGALGPLGAPLSLYGVLLAFALVVLRGRLSLVLRPQPAPHGSRAFRWNWRGTGVALIAGAGAMAVPALWAVTLGEGIGLRAPGPGLWATLALQVAIVGLVEELYFREAALKALGPSPLWVAAISLPVFAAIHWQGGPFAIGVAFGVGGVYLAARLAGAPVLALALVHGLVNTAFQRLVAMPVPDGWAYLAVVLPGWGLVALGLWLSRRGRP